MATVYERCKKLGIAYSNCIGQFLGPMIRDHVYFRCHGDIKKRIQTEFGEEFYVNDYPNDLTNYIDQRIIEIVTRPPGKVQRRATEFWWKNYKEQKTNRR